MLGIIVFLEQPTSLQHQCLDWPLSINFKNFLIYGGIHSSFHSYSIPFAPSCHTTLNNNGSTSMPNSWQGVLLYKGFTLFLQKIPSLVVAKKFNFGFISPKYIVPNSGSQCFLLQTCICYSILQLCCSDVGSSDHFSLGLSILNLSWSSRPWLDYNCSCSICLPLSNNVSDSGKKQIETLRVFCHLLLLCGNEPSLF